MFRNREHAGFVLAERLSGQPMKHPIVLAITRGGAIVGAALARRLGVDFDVLTAGRLYARGPCAGEGPIGAVTGCGAEHLIPGAVEAEGATPEGLQSERRYQAAELARRNVLYRRVRPAAETAERTVILVDDGVTTGATILAALRALKARNPGEVIVALPILPKPCMKAVADCCDRVVAVLTPESAEPLERHFADFGTVDDEAVLERLRHHVRTGAAEPVPGAA